MNVYDTVEIEDMEFDEDLGLYKYPCPCGDVFQITLDELYDGEDIAKCPSCSLLLRVVYDPEDFADDQQDLEFDSRVLIS
ncbi:Diphthamide biosynthesis protein 3 [Smittium mucronatum]|uniref:Diphthamide biosynthesis protein 3 n=1 Tax=Smittium mucronatum TaxID=133383 RepID=A0A1R0GZ15_9FUNG|nr:Diphthamide biosynthesis protein 3 [Smittium mucronatum]